MDRRLGDVTLHWVEHGKGPPLVALHGAGVDHRELEGALEPLLAASGCRRVYPDLPGTGATTADGLTSNDDVVALLDSFLDHLGGGPVLLLGHSYGGYLARGLAARRPDAVRGLALVCPLAEHATDVPAHEVVVQLPEAYAELDPSLHEGFDAYVVVRTPATARSYRDHVVPGTTAVDEAALERVFAGWPVDVGGSFGGPALLVAGHDDSTVGYADTVALLGRYPHATLAVVDGAGHALPHERPAVLGALLADWLDRAGAAR